MFDQRDSAFIRVRGARTHNLKATLHTQSLGVRPQVYLDPCDHPLAHEQKAGITLDRARELAERCLHG